MPMQFWEPVTFKAMGTISTASSTTNHTSATGIRYFSQMQLFLHITTISGTTKTLTVNLQTKGPDGNWYNLPTGGTVPYKWGFTAKTATGLFEMSLHGPLGKEVRARSVLSAASRGRWGIFGLGLRELP